MIPRDESFDVAVVGAGPAGAATALRLARAGCRVILLERSHFEAPRVGESLAPAVQPLLVELGLWSDFLALEPLPSFGTRSIWGEEAPTEHSHLFNPYGHGWHVDRRRFDHMLANVAAAAGVDLRPGTLLKTCEATDQGRWRLGLQGPDLTLDEKETTQPATEIEARVVIDATGRRARLGRCLGARRITLDRLVGVAATIDVESSDQGFLLIEAGTTGWWYSAPLPQNRLMAMWMTDSDLCRRARLTKPAAWKRWLVEAPATSERVSRAVRSTTTELGPALRAPCLAWGPHLFPATSQRVRRGADTRPWLAVGDASLAVDPISGSGVVRALRSAKAGAEAALALLHDPSCGAVEAYEAERDLECTAFLVERSQYYGLEERWSAAPFWQRRSLSALR